MKDNKGVGKKRVIDVEGGFPPSIVDSSGYKPLKNIVERCVPGGLRGLAGRGIFEVGEDEDPEEAIEKFDPTRGEDFDLADASRIIEEAQIKLKQLKGLKKDNRKREDSEKPEEKKEVLEKRTPQNAEGATAPEGCGGTAT